MAWRVRRLAFRLWSPAFYRIAPPSPPIQRKGCLALLVRLGEPKGLALALATALVLLGPQGPVLALVTALALALVLAQPVQEE